MTADDCHLGRIFDDPMDFWILASQFWSRNLKNRITMSEFGAQKPSNQEFFTFEHLLHFQIFPNSHKNSKNGVLKF